MKKLLLITIMLLGITAVKAQCNLPYKDLRAFDNDTTAFFAYNFIDRADCYKGKTLNDLVKDMQLPIKGGHSYTQRNTMTSFGIMIGIHSNGESLGLINNNRSTNTIHVFWEEPIEIDLLLDRDIQKGVKPYSTYLEMYKNCRIKEVKLPAPEEAKPQYKKYQIKAEEERKKRSEENRKEIQRMIRENPNVTIKD